MMPLDEFVQQCRGLDIRAEVYFLMGSTMLSMEEYLVSIRESPKRVLKGAVERIDLMHRIGTFLYEHRN